MLRGVGENVRNDPHGGRGRIDIGVADHELLEDVVLDRPAELLRRHALLFACDDEQRQHRQNRAVHGHGHGHFRERNAVKQRTHIVNAIDGDARHADIALDAGVIAVITAMSRQIEGDGKTFLSGGQVTAIKSVGLLGRRKAGILPDRPGLAHIHRRIGAAKERRETGHRVEEGQLLKRLFIVNRRNGNPFRRQPCLLRGLRRRTRFRYLPFHLAKIG